MTPPDDATRAQIAAADPGRSTWLSANAGSGKTRVLTDRVARLLLEGAPPQNILCLTYTKAAAGEMQNRLFKTLGGWAMMAEDTLAGTLSDIGAEAGVDLSQARRLFARAIETPGGLKIQTIHSFCAALLRQFPLEAGVSPGFTEMDESTQHHLLADVLEALAETDPGGVVSGFARCHSGHEVEKSVAEIVGKREAFRQGADRAAVLQHYGAPEDLTVVGLVGRLHLDPELFRRLRSVLKSGSSSDLKALDAFIGIDAAAVRLSDLVALEGCMLTGEKASPPFSSKSGKFPTKGTRARLNPEDLSALDALMDRVAALRPLRLALEAAERTLALNAFAGALLPAYEAEKSRRGLLDFDDLIAKATDLLSDSASAAWVLYRLDGKIDHILVDESQDTSPAQWRLIERLTEEFGAGAGVRANAARTLFVVGDKKQSIYSFQGADAEAFDGMRDAFGERLLAAGGLADRALLHSFRSAPAILNAVDATFAGEAGAGLGGAPEHIAFHAGKPGRVDLWPLQEPAEDTEQSIWYDPVDLVAPDNPSAVLARRIADTIPDMIADPGFIVTDRNGPRRAHAGDFLLLVPGRTGQGDMFQSLIRALKTKGLPVAGADVMRLDEELAVRDLKALLSFLALPEDSLSLAALLRSPLLGWSEDALFRLAAGRPDRFLWRTLESRAAEFPETVAVLRDLRDQSDFLRPFDLLERALVRHDGRRRLTARLGAECEDAIDEMLSLALAYERQEVPSLTGFLAWLDREATEVKRALDRSGGAIRVMTVHGAKGLESPVVILPDTMRKDRSYRDNVVLDAAGAAHWPGRKADRPDAVAEAVEAVCRRDALERQRLLYVAMTRAESWLIVCGAGDPQKCDGTWYGDVRAGLLAAGAAPLGMPTGDGLRLETGDWSKALVGGTGGASEEEPPLPDWSGRPALAIASAKVLSPSDLGGAKALPGEGRSEDEALRHGRQAHLLLEHLPATPRERHAETAVALLAFGEDAAPEDQARRIGSDISALLSRGDLAEVFAEGALAEVEVTAEIPELGGRRIRGVIDRLVVGPERVTIIDFKTNAVVPERPEAVPDGILRQMAAYASAVRQIYPDRDVELAILWTATGALMVLPHEIVMRAIAQNATS